MKAISHPSREGGKGARPDPAGTRGGRPWHCVAPSAPLFAKPARPRGRPWGPTVASRHPLRPSPCQTSAGGDGARPAPRAPVGADHGFAPSAPIPIQEQRALKQGLAPGRPHSNDPEKTSRRGSRGAVSSRIRHRCRSHQAYSPRPPQPTEARGQPPPPGPQAPRRRPGRS